MVTIVTHQSLAVLTVAIAGRVGHSQHAPGAAARGYLPSIVKIVEKQALLMASSQYAPCG